MILLEFDIGIGNELEKVFDNIDLVFEIVVGLLKVLELKQLRLFVQLFLGEQHVVNHLVDGLFAIQQLLRALSELREGLRALREEVDALLVLSQPLHAS